MPESKSISWTVPVTSEPSVPPWMATTVPIAERAACQLVASTLAVATASGGGMKDLPALIIVLICNTLIPASRTTTSTTPAIAARVMRLRVLFGGGADSTPTEVSWRSSTSASARRDMRITSQREWRGGRGEGGVVGQDCTKLGKQWVFVEKQRRTLV